MGRIEQSTAALIRCIQESEEYIQFCKCRAEVERDPELHRQINEFRLRVYETQNSRDAADMYEEQIRLGRENEEFRRNPLVNEFLQAELHVCRIMQKIMEEIAGSVDLDDEWIIERIEL